MSQSMTICVTRFCDAGLVVPTMNLPLLCTHTERPSEHIHKLTSTETDIFHLLTGSHDLPRNQNED